MASHGPSGIVTPSPCHQFSCLWSMCALLLGQVHLVPAAFLSKCPPFPICNILEFPLQTRLHYFPSFKQKPLEIFLQRIQAWHISPGHSTFLNPWQMLPGHFHSLCPLCVYLWIHICIPMCYTNLHRYIYVDLCTCLHVYVLEATDQYQISSSIALHFTFLNECSH